MGADLSVRAYDLQTGQMRAYYEGNSAWNNKLSPYPYSIRVLDNRWLLLRGEMITVIYDLETGENTAIRMDSRRIQHVSPNGRYAYMALRDDLIRVWDLWNLPTDISDRLSFVVPSLEAISNQE